MDIWNDIIVTPLVNLLLGINSLVGNLGIAIILFTILIKVVTHPLMVKQLKGAAAMQTMQKDPRWIEAQQKYKNDKEKLAQVQMALYKEHGVSIGASCLPLLIQMPILFGLYQALTIANASNPFGLLNLIRRIYPSFLNIGSIIPINSQFLWMDMAQPERLIIPGIPIGIPVLAILAVVTTYMQTKLTAMPSTDQQSGMMMSMMNIYFPFMMGLMAYQSASGFGLYWVAYNILSIAQSAMLGKVNWANLIPGRKPVTDTSSGRSSQTASSRQKLDEKKALPEKVSAFPAKGGKTVKATKGAVKKPAKTNPKMNR